MKRRLGIVGLGAAARQIHLPACRKLPGLELVGGADPAVAPGAMPFPVYASAEELLDRARPDILAVATPPDLHYEVARQGLEAGCHVFCEKPFMPDLDQARRIIALSRSARRWVVVNNQYRFMNTFQEAKRRIGRPEFGDLLFLAAHQTFRVSAQTEAGWRGRDTRRTCQEFGTHVIDLCRFLFGAEPLEISARMPRPTGPGGPDLLNLIRLEFPGQRVAHITLDRLCRGPHRYLDLRLDGAAGCIETHLGGRFELRAGIRGGPMPYLGFDFSPGGSARLFHGERSRKIASEPFDLFARATRRLLQAFLDALDHDQPPPCHAEDNLHTLRLMLAAYESDRRGLPIPIAA